MFLPETINPLIRYIVYFLVFAHIAVFGYWGLKFVKNLTSGEQVKGADLWRVADSSSNSKKNT